MIVSFCWEFIANSNANRACEEDTYSTAVTDSVLVFIGRGDGELLADDVLIGRGDRELLVDGIISLAEDWESMAGEIHTNWPGWRNWWWSNACRVLRVTSRKHIVILHQSSSFRHLCTRYSKGRVDRKPLPKQFVKLSKK